MRPAHRGEAVREYLRTPELELRLVNLPGYSPDFNADEAVWGWAREEVTGNLCLGSRAAVQERVGKFLAGLSSRKDEVRRRCRTVLQSRAETLGLVPPLGVFAGRLLGWICEVVSAGSASVVVARRLWSVPVCYRGFGAAGIWAPVIGAPREFDDCFCSADH